MSEVVLITGASSGMGKSTANILLAKAATDKKPKTRYVKGYMAKLSIAVRKWFGDRIYDKMVLSQFK